MTPYFAVGILLVIAETVAGPDCRHYEHGFDLTVGHRVLERTNLADEAGVRISGQDGMLQVQVGASGSAKRARIVIKDMRGRVDVKWRDPGCRNRNERLENDP